MIAPAAAGCKRRLAGCLGWQGGIRRRWIEAVFSYFEYERVRARRRKLVAEY
jgi:hypothetical protein